MRLEAILFDADGMMIFPWRFARHLESEYGITPAKTRPFFQGVFEDCLVGKADLKEALPPYLASWGWEDTLDAFVTTWFEVENAVDKRLVAVIRRLREAGYRCCLASSQEKYRAAYMTNEMGFAGVFERLFFSYDLGCQKPERAYYERVERELDLPGEGILFWDDSPANVESARACGWEAEVYTDYDPFLRRMAVYLGEDVLPSDISSAEWET